MRLENWPKEFIDLQYGETCEWYARNIAKRAILKKELVREIEREKGES